MEEERLPIPLGSRCRQAEAVEGLPVRPALLHLGRTNPEASTRGLGRRGCRSRPGTLVDRFLHAAASEELFEIHRLRRRSVVDGLFLWERDDALEAIEEEEEAAAAPVLELPTELTGDFVSDGVGVEVVGEEEAVEAVDELLELPLPGLRLCSMLASLEICG